MQILLSNDDGYFAPGLKKLAQELKKIGHVTVMAPDHNCSGSSSALTFDRPLTVTEIEPSVYAINGTPADCVHLALTGLLDRDPDLVISGINGGANLGDDTVYSGTVAAAREGFLAGIHSFSFSQNQKGWQYLDDCARVCRVLLEKFLAKPLPKNPCFFNVNFPVKPAEELHGFVAARLGRRHRAKPLIRQNSPRGVPVYWLGPAGDPKISEQGTDFSAVQDGFVSVTPLHVDFTDHDEILHLTQWLRAQ